MAIDVYVADEQADHRVEIDRWARLARSVLEDRRIPGDVEVSILFVDEGAIAALNEQFLSREGPTDVLAFPIEDEPLSRGRSPDSGGNGPGVGPEDVPLMLLGDVVICPAVAARHAVDHDVTVDDELALLVVHGLLHLLGMDHEDPKDAEVMEALEKELLSRHDGERELAVIPSHPVVASSTFRASDWVLIAVVVVLLAASGFLALAETSLVRTNRVKARALLDEHRRGARPLVRLVEHPENFLNPVLLLVLVCQLVSATLVGVLASAWLGAWGVLVGTVFEVIVIFVVFEAVPKNWAVHNPERAALFTAPFVAALVRFPPIRAVSKVLIGLANLFIGRHGNANLPPPRVTEAELLAMADVAQAEHVIEQQERTFIHSIIDFGDAVVREVMVPRLDMFTLEESSTVGDSLDRVLAEGRSRVPVHRGDVDDVVGIAYARDLMFAEREGSAGDEIGAHLRQPHYVPETKRLTSLLREMQAAKFHMSIVVDEYGSTVGLVTLEDLIEELVGEIVDEFDVEEPVVETLPDGSVVVSGRMAIDDVDDLLGTELPREGWDTVGGLMLAVSGRVPQEEESVEVDGVRLVAQRVQGRRISRVRIERTDHVGAPDEDVD